MALKFIRADLFSATSANNKITILAHACNPFGLWGAGVASQFRVRYPVAYKHYVDHCRQNEDVLGTCFLAPSGIGNITVACLFTSDFSNSPSEIISYTEQALLDLARQVEASIDVEKDENNLPVINMPQINSGIFNVPWEMTETALIGCSSLGFRIYVI